MHQLIFSKMNKWQTTKGTIVFQVLSGRSNVYFVASPCGNILVDTGKSNSYKNLQQNIGKLPIAIKKIDYLFLSHSHFDHCQNAAAIVKKNNCKTIAHKKAVKFIEDGLSPLPKANSFLIKPIIYLGKLFEKSVARFAPFGVDIVIDHRYYINQSNDLQIITTPGHSTDSISLLIDNEIALVGDAMFGIFSKKIMPPFADNKKQLIESWLKLSHTGCKIFLPGHGKSVKQDLLEKEINRDHF